MFLNGSYYFPDTAIDCRKGGGKGGNEVILNGNYSVEKCVAEVQKQYPKANGASMNFDCPNKCSCWAEFNMDRWSGSSYQACYFKKSLKVFRLKAAILGL